MGLFSDLKEKFYDNRVNEAIHVLNTTQSKTLAIGAVTTLAKHPDANPFAVRTLRKIALSYPEPSIQALAMESLIKISTSHKDSVVRDNVQRILDEFNE
ncbi:MAG: hypothetical protein KZQ89_19335 [Candidatus Thiodiazotropha sp. (ex Lucinoma kastoroae)]|nr:hypothetical protein [Candidatus Thiodiazotropha sp. (ex Lucinoma kastoroae)]